MPPLLTASLAAFLLLAGVTLYGLLRDGPAEPVMPRQGGPVPAFTVDPLGDFPVLTEDALRQPGVKLVNFWASWCVPCRAEHPTLVWMAENLDVTLYGINYADDAQAALEYLDELGNPYRALGRAGLAQARADWGVEGIPETLIIDANGFVTGRYAGPITRRVLKETIMPLIEEAKSR